MRKYFKPALKMEAFDIEDVITVSDDPTYVAGDNEDLDLSAAPIDVVVDFN